MACGWVFYNWQPTARFYSQGSVHPPYQGSNIELPAMGTRHGSRLLTLVGCNGSPLSPSSPDLLGLVSSSAKWSQKWAFLLFVHGGRGTARFFAILRILGIRVIVCVSGKWI